MSKRVDLRGGSVHQHKGFCNDQTTVKGLGTAEAMAEERKGTRDRDRLRSEAVEDKSNPHVRIQGFSLRWRLSLISNEQISKKTIHGQ